MSTSMSAGNAAIRGGSPRASWVRWRLGVFPPLPYHTQKTELLAVT